MEKQQRCGAWELKIPGAALGPKKGRVYPHIDRIVVDDEVAAARETPQEAAPGKEASSWAK